MISDENEINDIYKAKELLDKVEVLLENIDNQTIYDLRCEVSEIRFALENLIRKELE